MQVPPSEVAILHKCVKDAQCAKKNYGRKIYYHIISRLGKKNDHNFNFLHNWPNLQGELQLIWHSFFSGMTSFGRFLVIEIWSILNFPFVMHLGQKFEICYAFEKKNWWGGLWPPHPLPRLRPWFPPPLGLRTLAWTG